MKRIYICPATIDSMELQLENMLASSPYEAGYRLNSAVSDDGGAMFSMQHDDGKSNMWDGEEDIEAGARNACGANDADFGSLW